MTRASLRCAIYTRKSTEAGLEQDFNSLHAQRESCEAYIKSQAQEGWRVLPQPYDDGGFSGGSLKRPALQLLVEDIEARKVDTVVVYKVDRLSRSLTDFAKLVELFEANNVSFVSVTQQFNTTSSMGRLTLNVLLSFAQFEREVIGERIRDKIAASKKKGIWMGGLPPLGYDVVERQLVANAAEALQVGEIFRTYLEAGLVRHLKQELDRRGLVTKVRPQKNGEILGGKPFSRGHLYRLLSNPIYLGKLPHKGQVYDGRHAAIIHEELWDEVQSQLSRNKQGENRPSPKAPSLLAGLLFTDDGEKLVPSHAVKAGRRYRYYIEQRLTQDEGVGVKGARYAAQEVETAVLECLKRFLAGPADILAKLDPSSGSPSAVKQLQERTRRISNEFLNPELARRWLQKVVSTIALGDEHMSLRLKASELAAALDVSLTPEQKTITLETPCQLVRRGQELKLVLAAQHSAGPMPNRDLALIRAVAQAHVWWTWILEGEVSSLREIVRRSDLDPAQVTRRLRLAFLAPDLVRRILAGTQPANLTLEKLIRKTELPLSWNEQLKLLA